MPRRPLPADAAATERSAAEITAELRAANAELTAAIEANRQITSALRFSEARLRQITDTIPAHIAYFDKTWTYRYANRRYAEWFGWTTESIVDKPIPVAIGAKLLEQISHHVRRALTGEEVTYEYVLTDADGTERHARSTLVPDVGPDGEVLGCFVHAVDITEQRRTQSALAQAQKMEAIGQLTGGLAHDFNNMLTVVTGNLTELREARPDDPLIAEYVDPALHAAHRGAALIKRLLTFARQQPLSPRPVEVRRLILDVARLIRRSLPEHIVLHTQTAQPEPVALVDPHQLESAVLNLALNARDAMPSGGELRIEAGIETVDAAAAADLEIAPGAYVQIAVHDNGEGMDGSTLARVFEPFFTTKKSSRGSGLGMAMVYGFVRQSGGAVRIRSRQACGTTVALLLPCADGYATHGDEPGRELTDPAGWLAGKLVLLVEDAHDVRKVVRKQLAALGCAVLEAESGQEAAGMVENIDSIALVVSDVVMHGGMDGLALARFVRRFRPTLPIILMSGYTEAAELISDDLDLPILAKPFTREALYVALGRVAPFMPTGSAP
jgi:PAS domain S-box-containing protein